MALTFGTPFVYSTLVGDVGTEGSIRSWGSHAAIPADQVLTEAQAWIYGRLRAREMISVSELALLTNDQSMTLPAGWQAMVFLRLDGDSQDLDFSHESWVRFRQSDGTMPTGKPTCYTILDKVYWDVQVDQGYTGTGYAGELAYYGTPAALSVGNPTNFLCTRFPTLLRKVCTGFAYESRRRLQDADDMFQQAMAEVEKANEISGDYRRGQIGLR